MKKVYYIIVVLLIGVTFNGCGSKYIEGSLKKNYNTFIIDKNLSKDKVTLIKVANGLKIWKVDGIKRISAFRISMRGGLDSISIKEGKHTFGCFYNAQDINIGSSDFKAEHEYLIDYIAINNYKIYYWIEDLTTKKIIYGKKKTIADFENKKKN